MECFFNLVQLLTTRCAEEFLAVLLEGVSGSVASPGLPGHREGHRWCALGAGDRFLWWLGRCERSPSEPTGGYSWRALPVGRPPTCPEAGSLLPCSRRWDLPWTGVDPHEQSVCVKQIVA